MKRIRHFASESEASYLGGGMYVSGPFPTLMIGHGVDAYHVASHIKGCAKSVSVPCSTVVGRCVAQSSQLPGNDQLLIARQGMRASISHVLPADTEETQTLFSLT
jgi:hypothetical protein